MSNTPYTTGTISVTNGSATVTGTGTGWEVALVTGGMFSAAGMSIPISAVVSDTEITLAYAWPGVNFSGAYAIAREYSESVRATWINDRLARVLATMTIGGVTPKGAGTEAERNALDPQPTYDADDPWIWLRLEASEDVAFSIMTGSGWSAWYAFPAGADGADFAGGLGDLSNVTLTSVATGEAVVFNGSAFVNQPVAVTTDISEIVKIEQSAYDLLAPPDADTLYVIIADEV